MKKLVKAIISAVLCLVMVFAVSACVATPPADSVQIPAGTKNAVVVRSVKGTNNMDATLAWAECAISVWLKLEQDGPREVIDYYWSDAEKARINELNNAVIAFSESGLKHNSQGLQGAGYTTANWLTAQSMMTEIRKNISVKTVIEKYKPTLQLQLDSVNNILANGK